MMRYLLIIAMTLGFTAGCSDHFDPVDYPPAAPTDVYSITGDGEATLVWNPNNEPDLDIYAVYSCEEEFGRYELEGTTDNTYYTVYFPNGITRYLAVAAVDFIGNESELSYSTVWDTPRPEGYNLTVFALLYDSLNTNSSRCAVDFSDYNSQMVQALDNPSNDIYIDNFEGTLYINAYAEDTDIALFGVTSYLSDVDYIDPEQYEWAEEGYFFLAEDYSYVVWTWDNHFAAIRVLEVYPDRAVLAWAYQIEEGNPQLKISGIPGIENEQQRTRKIRPKTRVSSEAWREPSLAGLK
ncbi:hypothetical protein ACFL5L_02550 [candidate division KSB1 bacterium]